MVHLVNWLPNLTSSLHATVQIVCPGLSTKWPRYLCDWNSWRGHPLRNFCHNPKTTMKTRIIEIAAVLSASVIACAISADAAETWTEMWTCTHSSASDNQPTVTRFEASPPDLIEVNFHQMYHIEKNNDYGLVATSSISKIEQGHKIPTVGAAAVIINKMTGEFWWVSAITAEQPAAVNQPAHGKCIKD